MNDIDMAHVTAHMIRSEWLRQHPYVDPAQVMPLPIREIIAETGIEVAEKPYRDMKKTLAYLDPEEPLIWLREHLPASLHMFTLAHELGHWHLHRTNGAQDPCEIDEYRDVLGLHPEEAYSPRSLKEQQADAFAIELLAPLQLVATALLPEPPVPAMTLYQVAERLGLAPRHVFMQIVRLLKGESALPVAADTRGAQTPQLDAEQIAAAHIQAPALVVAGPGSGKTSTLVARVRWLIEQGQPSNSILALTFSRKAATEMYQRIVTALNLAPHEMPTITTFHRFGAEVLRRYGHTIDIPPSFQLYDEIASYLLLQTCVPALELEALRSLRSPMQHYPMFLEAISRAKDDLIQPMDLFIHADEIDALPDCSESDHLEAAKLRDIARVYDAYSLALFENHGADFGDLIMQTIHVFEEKPEILQIVRKSYQSILVDEFQDINYANNRLLKMLAGKEQQIWAVGDAFQSIYRFRGASPENISSFTRDYPDARMISLSNTYRSQRSIINAANAFALTYFADGIEGQPVSALRAIRNETDGEVRILECETQRHELATIAQNIHARLDSGLSPESCAVLCRTHTTAQRMAAELRRQGIPAEIATDIFDDEQIKALLGFAGVMAEEYGGLLALTHVPGCQLPRELVLQVMDALRNEMTLDESLALLQHHVADRADILPTLRLIQKLLAMLAKESSAGIVPAMMRLVFGELAHGHTALQQRGEFALHLIELFGMLQRFDAHFTMPLAVPDEEHTRYRWHACMDFLRMLVGLKRNGTQQGTRAHGVVQVMTVHGAKGLEWPVVYVPGVAHTYFPSTYRKRSYPQLRSSVAGKQTDEKLEHQREETHLFYVAMTRARDNLILTHAKKYGKTARKPSEYLSALVLLNDVQQMELIDDEDEIDEDATMLSAADLAYDPLQRLSAGAITTYLRCPRQFAYSNVYRLRNRSSGFLHMRNAVFKTLQESLPDRESTADVAEIFERVWDAEKAADTRQSADSFIEYYHREGVKLAKHIHAGIRAEQGQPPERLLFAHNVDVLLEGEVVRVQVDRLVYSEGDHHGPRAYRHQNDRLTARKDPDLLDYFILLAQQALQGDVSSTSISDYLAPLNRNEPIEVSVRRQHNFRQKAVEAIAGIRAGTFFAQPDDEQCQRCPFILHCSY